MTGFTAQDIPDQSGRCIVVTGANTGLGFEASRMLAAKGARVLLACRNEEKARDAMARIATETPGADLGFVPLDQADLDSVRAAAEQIAGEPCVDVLLNNAGVMFPPLERTRQGFELQFGVNHLGTFALTALLLPRLAEAPEPRVVITASLAHRGGNIAWDDLNAQESYNRTQRYSDSKLANMLHLFELDRRLRATGSPVIATGCHPGFAATDLMRHSGIFRLFTPVFGLLFNSAEQGAWPSAQAATDRSAQGGDYFGPIGFQEIRGKSGKAKRTDQARDPELARRLWDVSVAMTGIDPGLPPA
jgi:NAD(P)-dependent dehydrogenase (short-subunit alcohol dehydrogenase family)